MSKFIKPKSLLSAALLSTPPVQTQSMNAQPANCMSPPMDCTNCC